MGERGVSPPVRSAQRFCVTMHLGNALVNALGNALGGGMPWGMPLVRLGNALDSALGEC